MSILVDEKTRVVVQELLGTGNVSHEANGRIWTKVMAGTTPGKGGQTMDGIPVYNTVLEAVKPHWGQCFSDLCSTCLCNRCDPGSRWCGIHLIVCLTEGIPTSIWWWWAISQREGSKLIGPNTPGSFHPANAKSAWWPVISTSGTDWNYVSKRDTHYEVVDQLTKERNWTIDLHWDWRRSDHRA